MHQISTSARKSLAAASQYALESLESRLLLAGDLLASWNFNEGSGLTAADSSGNGRTAQVVGPTWVAQGSGYALSFDGRDDYVTAGTSQSIGIAGPLSLECWIKPLSKAHGEAVLLGETYSSYVLTYYDGELGFFYIGGGGNSIYGKLRLGEWNHVVAGFNGSSISLYINGKVIANNPSKASSYQATGTFKMGTQGRPDLPQFKGLLDDVRVYNRALTASEATSHFESEAAEHGFDPLLFTEPKITPYYYLHDEDPRVVIEADYTYLTPVNGRVEVKLANRNKPATTLVRRMRNPVPASGQVDVTIPMASLPPGGYVITVNFNDDAGVAFSRQYTFSHGAIAEDDFQDDAIGAVPSGAAHGSWLAGSGIAGISYGGSRAMEFWNGSGPTMNGFFKASAAANAPGDSVHAEFKLDYRDGYATVGLSSDITATNRAGQEANALMFLMFQDVSGGATLGVNAMNASGNYVNLGNQFTFHNADNPYPVGQSFDLIELDYVVGASAGKLTINGVVISNAVPLRQPGGAVNGVFFTDLATGHNNYVIDDVLLTSTSSDAALSPVPSPQQTIVGALPVEGATTPYSFTLRSGGGFDLTINGVTYPFRSRFSWPSGSFNTLAATAGGESSWQLTTQAVSLGNNRYRVTAGGGYYTLIRDIEVFPTHVSVKDSFTNTRNQDLGLLVYNEVPVDPAQVNVSLLAGYDRIGRQVETTIPDYGPSTFFTDSHTGIGVVPVDDVFIVQAISYVAWQNAAGVGTEKFALGPNASYALEWAVYPTGSKNYYDFVNAFRTAEGRIARIDDTPGFTSRTTHVPGRREVPSTEYVTKRGLTVGIVHALSEIADDPNLHIEGFEYIDFPLERALLTQQMAATHAKFPDLKVVLHESLSLYATNQPSRYADSRVILANGQQATFGNGDAFGPVKQADGWRWYSFYPTTTNSYGQAMLNSVNVLMDEMGFDGGFLDGFTSPYGAQWTYDSNWDGHSAEINTVTRNITRRMSSVILLSQAALIQYAQSIRDKGGAVVSNNSVLTRSVAGQHYIIFDNEVASGPQLHLAPSITALSNSPFASEKDLYLDMLDKLSWGVLYIPYTDGLNLTHRTLASMQFPITFARIGAGMVKGPEKIVTMNSGIYGWAGSNQLHMVRRFDSRGALSMGDQFSTIDANGVRTSLNLSASESAVIEPVPLSLSAGMPVNARMLDYSAGEIRASFNGVGSAGLMVDDGTFKVRAGRQFEVSVNGAKSLITADSSGRIMIPLALNGQSDVSIVPRQVAMNVSSTPVTGVDVVGVKNRTNTALQINQDAGVTLTAPRGAANSAAADRFGFTATQASTGIRIFNSNGAVLQTLNRNGLAMEFAEDGSLFVGDSSISGGKYSIWRYPYQNNSTWGTAQKYCEVNGRPRALALDAAGALYIGLDDSSLSNVYKCDRAGQTPVLFGGPNDSARQIQDMEVDPDGKLWVSRYADGYMRYPLTGGFVPELTITNQNSVKVGGFEFGPDRNGDGKPELYGSVDGMLSNIGYYDYESGVQLGTLISDDALTNYCMTFGPDRNNDGEPDIYVLNYSDKLRIYDSRTGTKITEMAAGLPISYVSGGIPRPYRFLRWTLDGVDQPLGQNTIALNPTADVSAVARYNATSAQLVAVASRKSSAGISYDLDFPLPVTQAVEPRAGGPTQLVLMFGDPISKGPGFAVTLKRPNGSANGIVSGTTVDGTMLLINLSGVSDAETLVVDVTDILHASNSTSQNLQFSLGVLLADATRDGKVNTLDFNQLAGTFGMTGAIGLNADFNLDGIVNSQDFNALTANFGRQLSPGAALPGGLPSSVSSALFGDIGINPLDPDDDNPLEPSIARLSEV